MSAAEKFLGYSSTTALYAFTLFVLTALPVSIILDGAESSHTKDSLTRNLDFAADGLNSGGYLLEWYGLLNANVAGGQQNSDLAAMAAAFIIIAIFVITCLEQADTQLQPSPDPDQGEEFRAAALQFDDLRGQVLHVPQPTADQWSGWAAEGFTDSNDAQRARLQQMADADNQVATTLRTQAAQVTQARREVAGAKLVLATAIPGAAALYKLNPWASTVWQLVCGVAAITEVVTAYVNLHDKSQHNATEVNKATAVYTQVQQSARAATPSAAAQSEIIASTPSLSPTSPNTTTPGSTFRAADSQTAESTQQQTPATAPPSIPTGRGLGPRRVTALPTHSTNRKTATAQTDPAESIQDAEAAEQSAEPQPQGVPIDPVQPASTPGIQATI